MESSDLLNNQSPDLTKLTFGTKYTDIRYSDITPCIDLSVVEPDKPGTDDPQNELGDGGDDLLT